jgi:hypothetical protein
MAPDCLSRRILQVKRTTRTAGNRLQSGNVHLGYVSVFFSVRLATQFEALLWLKLKILNVLRRCEPVMTGAVTGYLGISSLPLNSFLSRLACHRKESERYVTWQKLCAQQVAPIRLGRRLPCTNGTTGADPKLPACCCAATVPDLILQRSRSGSVSSVTRLRSAGVRIPAGQ